MTTVTTDARHQFATQQRALLAESQSGAVSREIALPGPVHRVHFLEAGQGEPVVLLHGGGGIALEWLPLLAPLAVHFHVFVPDRPGCGLTELVDYRHVDFREHAAHFVEAFLDALALPQVTLVGNSIGGFFSLAFALAHPERVRKLVLLGTPLGVRRWIPPAMRALGIPGPNRLLFATVAKPSPGGTRERYRRMLVANIATVPPAFLQTAYRSELIPGTQESWRSLLECTMTLRGLNTAYLLVDALPNVQPSTLLIWGDKDVFGSPAHGTKTRDLIPDARLAIVKDTGHIPWFDAPEECGRLITDFVAETAGNNQTIGHGRQ